MRTGTCISSFLSLALLTIIEKQMAMIDHERHFVQKVVARPRTRGSVRFGPGISTDGATAGRLGCRATCSWQRHTSSLRYCPLWHEWMCSRLSCVMIRTEYGVTYTQNYGIISFEIFSKKMSLLSDLSCRHDARTSHDQRSSRSWPRAYRNTARITTSYYLKPSAARAILFRYDFSIVGMRLR